MMKGRLSYLLLASAVLILLASCSHGPRVISRSTMADIYADMFLSDQWLNDHGEFLRDTDSTRFYEPVFNKYGYTSEDFVASVDKYIKDPERYSRILKKAYTILQQRMHEDERQRDQELKDERNSE